MNQSCSNCNAGIFQDHNGAQGACRAHPPTPCVVLIPRGQVQMELVPTPITAWPIVQPGNWCREWQDGGPKIQLMS